MKRQSLIGIFTFTISILIGGCSASIPMNQQSGAYLENDRYATLIKDMSASIVKGMKKHKVTGMSVALVDDGQVVWAQGFGYADKENGRLADANTLYRAGSISKLFTATAIMQLVEQSKVDLDAPIQKYIPELKPRYHFKVDKPITLRHIMSHRSGLPGDMVPGMFTRHPERFDNEIAYINSVHSPYAPGEVFAYSNIATDLQGIVMERVTGMKFEDYIQQYILSPLKMKQSTFIESAANPQLMSRAYSKHNEQELYPVRNIPAGSLRTNVLDLSRFATMVMQQGTLVLKQSTLQHMLVRQRFDNEVYDKDMAIGLNWVVGFPGLDSDTPIVWHNGGTPHQFSSMAILPEEGLAVIVMTNSDGGRSMFMSTTAEMIKAAVKAKSAKQIHSYTPPISPTQEFSAIELEQLPGHYATQLGEVLISRKGDKLKLKLAGMDLHLQQHEDGWSTIHAKLLGLIPIHIPQLNQLRFKIVTRDDEQLLLVSNNGMESAIGSKINPYNGDLAQWQSLTGTWKAKVPEDDYAAVTEVKIKVENGFIYIIPKAFGPVPRMIAMPVADNMLVIQGIGRMMRETIYIQKAEGKTVLETMGIQFYRQD